MPLMVGFPEPALLDVRARVEGVDAARAARHLDDQLLPALHLGQDLVAHLHPGQRLELRDVRHHLVDPRVLVEQEVELLALEPLPVEALRPCRRPHEGPGRGRRQRDAAEPQHGAP
jgi:hypothetical protein